MPVRARLRDLGLYLLIGGTVASLPVFAVVLDVRRDTFLRWFGLGFFTAFLFGFFIEGSRPLWKKRSFWAWTAVLFLAHSTLCLILELRGIVLTGHSLWIAFVAESAVLIVFRSEAYKGRLP